ncbi:MAG: hypothetical protein HFI93_03085 [Lachnospiraceae bacterium]|nr:hypothetical protein [Lachnospiraceae bacterium]
MANPNFIPLTGRIQNVRPFPDNCCSQMVTLRTENGPVQFVVTPETFVAGGRPLRPRMLATFFYDSTLPVPLIQPPQYTAIAAAPLLPGQTAALAFFNEELVAEDQSLQLNPGRGTAVFTANGQRYACHPGNNLLLVYYQTTTRSLPPQTTPDKIFVLC